MKKGCRYGTHRVISPEGTLPQPAIKLDNTMEIYDNEVLIDVQTLNIDSASYTQIKQACNGDASRMEEMILAIVKERGKMQNPVTGSGGMLIGTVKEIGSNFPDKSLKVGDKIATLVSLSLTPLKIHRIKKLDPASDQVDVDAEAILFESGLYAILPHDIPEKLALALLDVAGAPAPSSPSCKRRRYGLHYRRRREVRYPMLLPGHEKRGTLRKGHCCRIFRRKCTTDKRDEFSHSRDCRRCD